MYIYMCVYIYMCIYIYTYLYLYLLLQDITRGTRKALPMIAPGLATSVVKFHMMFLAALKSRQNFTGASSIESIAACDPFLLDQLCDCQIRLHPIIWWLIFLTPNF